MEGPFFYQVMDDDAVPRRLYFREEIIAAFAEKDPTYHVFTTNVEVMPFRILAAGVLYLVGKPGDVAEI